MLELKLETAELKVVNGHRYYVFPAPLTHTNQENRPTEYANEKELKTYAGKGSNNEAKLHPDVLTPACVFMTALLEYGEKIDDWSIRSAVIQSGYRADDPSHGANYLRIIKQTIARHPGIFGELTFPSDLEETAKGVLGRPGDPRRRAFQKKWRKRRAGARSWRPNCSARPITTLRHAARTRMQPGSCSTWISRSTFARSTTLSGARTSATSATKRSLVLIGDSTVWP